MKQTLLTVALLSTLQLSAQDYTSYFTGSAQNVQTNPSGGICVMGGATEHDEAMKWFLQRANGGDILVLRASGSNGYNDYLYSDLGVMVNSVETIVCNNSNASNDPYVINKIAQAEAIWFAGGDQWNYVSYWRNTPVDSAINAGLEQRNIVIGGTSAGMAIQGQYYFSAQNGSISSTTALGDPYGSTVAIEHAPFIHNPQLAEVITDTHFDNPDRSGRLITFMARMRTDDGIVPKAIACNEYVAVCIDPSGTASVYGDYPNYQEFAYFLQLNCEEENNTPETCVAGNPLTWSVNNNAVKAYKVPGTMNGANTFSLVDWSTGSGGEWQSWYVSAGTLTQATSSPIDCGLGVHEANNNLHVFPNPVASAMTISSTEGIDEISVYTLENKQVLIANGNHQSNYSLPVDALAPGIYFVRVVVKGEIQEMRFVKE